MGTALTTVDRTEDPDAEHRSSMRHCCNDQLVRRQHGGWSTVVSTSSIRASHRRTVMKPNTKPKMREVIDPDEEGLALPKRWSQEAVAV